MSSQYCELRPTTGWDLLASLRHPCKFQRVLRLGSVTAHHSSSGRQPNCGVEQRAHLYLAGRPSRWALAHSSSFILFSLASLFLLAVLAIKGVVVKTATPNSPDSQPLAGRTVSKWEDLWREVVLLKLTTFAKIPRPHRVVESSRPQLGPIWWDVYTTGTVGVPLELSANTIISLLTANSVFYRNNPFGRWQTRFRQCVAMSLSHTFWTWCISMLDCVELAKPAHKVSAGTTAWSYSTPLLSKRTDCWNKNLLLLSGCITALSLSRRSLLLQVE